VGSAGSYGAVPLVPVASARECNTFRKVTLVQHSPLFANVSLADCREIVSAARESEFSRRDTIFLEGDPIRQVILLTSGSVKVMPIVRHGTDDIVMTTG